MAKKKKSKPVKKGKASKAKKRKGKKGGSLGVLIAAVVIIALFVVVSQVKRGEPVKYIKATKTAEWGVKGAKDGELDSPRGVGVSKDGYVYVADMNNSRIVKFDREGKFVSNWGIKGNKAGQFNEPSGLFVSPVGDIFVADAWNGRIQRFDANGKYITEIGGQKASFYSPRAVGVSKNGIVYVADTGTSRVHRFDVEGNRLGNPVGGQGKGIDKFSEVFGIAFDSKGKVYAADPGNRRVVVLTSDLRAESEIKIKGWNEGYPLWPMLAIDSNDILYAVSSGTQDIWIYDLKEKKPKYKGTIKNDAKDKPLFSSPLGIAVDAENSVYVTDLAQNKVVKFRPVID